MARKIAAFGSGGDRAVMETSDDAAVSKHCAVEKGYYRVRNVAAPVYCARPASRACTPLATRKVSAEHAMTPSPSATDQDEYIKYFVNKPSNRPPLINRGHYSRVASVRYACTPRSRQGAGEASGCLFSAY